VFLCAAIELAAQDELTTVQGQAVEGPIIL